MPSIVYILPASALHGGIRVILEHAEGLQERGYEVLVVGPEPAPDWHPLTVPYRQIPLHEAGSIPKADICIGTFWTTVRPAFESGAPHVFHLCQGWEGVHREYASILDQIDATYRLPIPKMLISAHLEPVLRQRYNAETHLLGQAIDCEFFVPGTFREKPQPLTVGVVGPFGFRSKGIGEALEGFRLARQQGAKLEVHHASALPLSTEEDSLGVTDRFFHRLSTQEMVSFYHRLDLLVHPSHDEEGFPLPPLEAMACGVPVALTRIGSFRVLPQDVALRFDAGQPETLAPLVLEASSGSLRRNLRQAGLACARSMSLDKVLDRIEETFAASGASRQMPS
ncbi:MAG: glycosyltransferase family 4 protein [Deltaproteobacteria bacterium]|nr:glycosyltransferase family 4 protein [Deltaproteobacteria bacterium]